MTSPRCLVLLVALVTWSASPTKAQYVYCDASQFHALRGMWKLEPDQNTRQIPAQELAAERKVMQRVVAMFKSAFVPDGAAGYYGVNYDVLPHAVLNQRRYGNTYTFFLSNQKIECRNDKPVAMDVSYGNVSVQVNVHLVGEAEEGEPSAGFSYLPRGYYQLKDRIVLPEPTADGIKEFTFGDGTTVWWLTRPNRHPIRYVTRRQFLTRQIEIQRARPTPEPRLLAHYERMLTEATDDIAFVKQIRLPGSEMSGYAFTTLEDRSNRVYVTVDPDYYDRTLPRSAPQHVLIRIRHDSAAVLERTGNGARLVASFEKLREIVRANLAELRSLVK